MAIISDEMKENHARVRRTVNIFATTASLVGAFLLYDQIVCDGELQIPVILLTIIGLMGLLIEIFLKAEVKYPDKPFAKWSSAFHSLLILGAAVIVSLGIYHFVMC